MTERGSGGIIKVCDLISVSSVAGDDYVGYFVIIARTSLCRLRFL